uniref:NPR2 (negatively phytochrome regulated 2 protein) n=1 Tax=Lemna gibba TaxID=4470 RepID=Q40187_LEMGI|nr:NPR2 (negatively phytochrome regulated 2 [Lemna gibba]
MAQEKAEKMRAHTPEDKGIAAERKQQMMEQAELNKQQAKEENAAQKEQARAATVPGTRRRRGTAAWRTPAPSARPPAPGGPHGAQPAERWDPDWWSTPGGGYT